jgi:hypothetical protein
MGNFDSINNIDILRSANRLSLLRELAASNTTLDLIVPALN